ELLTQQYELAKVQEAKEIPTVKILDPAIVPTKKAYPPRTQIVLVGIVLGVAMAASWLVGKTRWNAMATDDPRKVFAIEVFTTTQAHLPRFAWNRNRSGLNGRATDEFSDLETRTVDQFREDVPHAN